MRKYHNGFTHGARAKNIMRLDDEAESQNVEDRRGGGGGGFRM